MTTKIGFLMAMVWFWTQPGFAAITWSSSFEAARAQAAASNRPVLIDFYTDWCGWCKKLDAEVFTNGRVVELSRRFVMLRLNAESEGAGLAQQFGVRGYPNIVLLTPAGQTMGQIAGYLPPADFAQLMEAALAYSPRQAVGRQSQERPAVRAAARPTPRVPISTTLPPQWTIDPKKTGAGANSEGVLLMDENGAVLLDAPPTTKQPAKTAAQAASNSAKGAQRRVRSGR
jgi:thiol-disulfide isomerase/thioredoxin